VTVKTGFFGSNETFVPTRSARLVQDHLEVPYPKEKIKGAPNVDVDSGGHLSVEEEQHLYRYYGIERTGGKGMSPDRSAGAAGAAGAAAGAGTAASTKSSGDIGTDISRGRSGGEGRMDKSAGAGSGAAFATGRGAPERTGAGDAEAEMMTRSEEEMHVKVERHPSGKARLHKYVEVEEVEQTVPLRHEEVKLEREALSASDREALRSGAEISESESFVTLHEESPVVETEVIAKERVRMRVEEHVEQKKVHGRVRKERIEADMEGPSDNLPGGDNPSRGGRPER
jgi:stress response protein YsnF